MKSFYVELRHLFTQSSSIRHLRFLDFPVNVNALTEDELSPSKKEENTNFKIHGCQNRVYMETASCMSNEL